MITHFETIITLFGVAIGWLAALVAGVWRVRGFIDRLNTTDGQLAHAIEELSRTQRELHAANQQRFTAIERRLRMRSS